MPSSRNSAAQGRVRNDSAVPDFRHQIFLADNAPAIADEEGQEVEDLWFDRDDIGSAAQFTQLRIERILVKQVDQGSARVCARHPGK